MAEKKEASPEAIQVKNEELENYFANTIIPQLFVDADLILRKFTPPAMTHFKLSEQDIGRDINRVKDNIKYPTIVENIQEVMSTGEILEKEVQTTDGKWYQMNMLPYKVRKEKRTNGVIITFVDITQRIYSLRDLEKLNAERETLMFALSHDVRQPVSALSLLEEVLKNSFDERDETKFHHYLKQLKISVKTVEALIDSFIAANDSAPEWEKKVERINIESVVEDIITGFKTEKLNTEAFECQFEASEIIFSRNNLRSIVYNLLNNAIKYRQRDRKLKVHISTKKVEGFVLLQVGDNGMGVAEENQKQIFEKGERLNPYVEGTGMGLYIIKRMLESMGGKITLKSKPGEGSTFSVFFKEKPLRRS